MGGKDHVLKNSSLPFQTAWKLESGTEKGPKKGLQCHTAETDNPHPRCDPTL